MDPGVTKFFGFLKDGLEAPGGFMPKPYYNQEGDTLFFYARDVQSYAKRLNPTLTLILATDDDSLVGFKIKGIQRILTRMQRLGMEKFVMDDQRIRLKILLEFALVAPPDDPALTNYEDEFGQYGDVIVDERELQLTVS